MRSIELQEQESKNIPPRKITMHFIPGPDARRYNSPTNDEIAAIFVGNDGGPPAHREFVVYPVGEHKERISYISCHLDLWLIR